MTRAMSSLAVIASLGAAAALHAIPVPPDPIPVTRLVAALSERAARNPDDAQAVFTLGRVHYFAFAGATDTVYVQGGSSAAAPALYDFFGERGKGRAAVAPARKPPSEAERLTHLENAITSLSRATAMKKRPDAEDGRYELCLACALEEGAPWAEKVGPIAGTPPTARAWLDAAIRYYGLAFDRAAADDGAEPTQPPFGLATLVSYEAGRSYARLIAARGGASADERARLGRITQHLARLERLPRGPITPLIFAVDRPAPLAELLSARVVAFDLDGTGRPQRYSWLRPDTAMLVWDPGHTGAITSGRQLFGSVTWWMLWEHAYEPLAVLDADRNGWLEGRELEELAVWFDRDQDGRSDAGEVRRIDDTPIAAIAAFPAGRAGAAPSNPDGLRLWDGRSLPTYDWIAEPQPPTTARAR